MFRTASYALLVGLGLALVGCYSWGAPQSPTAPALRQTRWGTFQVMLADGRRLRLDHARIAGDSLYGDTTVTDRAVAGAWSPFAAPLADVRSVAGRKFSAGRTAVAVAGISAVPVLAVVLLGRGGGVPCFNNPWC